MSFECKTGNIDVVNDGYSPGNDAYIYANGIYDAYLENYGIPPIKGTVFLKYVASAQLTHCNGAGNGE